MLSNRAMPGRIRRPLAGPASPAGTEFADGRPRLDSRSSGDGPVQNRLLITAEILFVVVTPLIVLYSKGNWRLRSTITCLLLIPVLWYLTYAPLHELSHVVGTYLAGGSVIDYQLIPRFWEGEFEIAWSIASAPAGAAHSTTALSTLGRR
jgi:hypothetical protein